MNMNIHNRSNIFIGFYYWFVGNDMIKNRTGSRWFLSVANLKESLTSLEVSQARFEPGKLVNLTTDYLLRTYTSGCYFLDETYNLWSGQLINIICCLSYREILVHFVFEFCRLLR